MSIEITETGYLQLQKSLINLNSIKTQTNDESTLAQINAAINILNIICEAVESIKSAWFPMPFLRHIYYNRTTLLKSFNILNQDDGSWAIAIKHNNKAGLALAQEIKNILNYFNENWNDFINNAPEKGKPLSIIGVEISYTDPQAILKSAIKQIEANIKLYNYFDTIMDNKNQSDLKNEVIYSWYSSVQTEITCNETVKIKNNFIALFTEIFNFNPSYLPPALNECNGYITISTSERDITMSMGQRNINSSFQIIKALNKKLIEYNQEPLNICEYLNIELNDYEFIEIFLESAKSYLAGKHADYKIEIIKELKLTINTFLPQLLTKEKKEFYFNEDYYALQKQYDLIDFIRNNGGSKEIIEKNTKEFLEKLKKYIVDKKFLELLNEILNIEKNSYNKEAITKSINGITAFFNSCVATSESNPKLLFEDYLRRSLKSYIFLPPSVWIFNLIKEVKIMSEGHALHVNNNNHTFGEAGNMINDLYFGLLEAFSSTTSNNDYITEIYAKEIACNTEAYVEYRQYMLPQQENKAPVSEVSEVKNSNITESDQKYIEKVLNQVSDADMEEKQDHLDLDSDSDDYVSASEEENLTENIGKQDEKSAESDYIVGALENPENLALNIDRINFTLKDHSVKVMLTTIEDPDENSSEKDQSFKGVQPNSIGDADNYLNEVIQPINNRLEGVYKTHSPTTLFEAEAVVLSENELNERQKSVLDPHKQEFVSYHPALPTIEMAKDHNNIISDRVPIFTNIPCRDNKASLSEIKIISWNVKSHGCNGFSSKNSHFFETESQKNARYERIVESLEKLINNNEPHFITLQDISYSEDSKSLIQLIKAKLGEKWQLHSSASMEDSEENLSNAITLYNNTIFDEIFNSNDDKKYYAGYSAYGTFVLKNDPVFTVNVLNVNARFNLGVVWHEEKIKEFLESNKDNNNLAILMGDFDGCDIAPFDNSSIIPTSLTSGFYNKPKIQGAAVDQGGAYCVKTIEGNIQFKQAKISHLNPVTGYAFTDVELPPLDISQLPPLQKKEINKFRVTMCFDDFYKKEKLINGKTIFEYQDKLRKKIKGTDGIIVRCAFNFNNETGICFKTPEINTNVVKRHTFLQRIKKFDSQDLFDYREFIPETKLVDMKEENCFLRFKTSYHDDLYVSDKNLEWVINIINHLDILEFIDQEFKKPLTLNNASSPEVDNNEEEIKQAESIKNSLTNFILEGKIKEAFTDILNKMSEIEKRKNLPPLLIFDSIYDNLKKTKNQMHSLYPKLSQTDSSINKTQVETQLSLGVKIGELPAEVQSNLSEIPIINFINDKFNSYSDHSRNFGFFSKATFDSNDIKNMKENLIDFIAQGKIAKAFYILQKEMDYVSKVKSNNFESQKNSLMYQKLQEIKNEMTKAYSFQANIYNTIHKQFDSYFNPSLLFRYKIFFDSRTYDKASVDNIELDLMNILDERAGQNENQQAQAIVEKLNKIIKANNVDVRNDNNRISHFKFKENSAMKKRLDNIIKNLQKNYPDNDSSDNINKL